MAAGRVQMTDPRASTHVTHPVTPALSGRDSRPRRVRLSGPSAVSRLPDRQGRPSPESRGGDAASTLAAMPLTALVSCQVQADPGKPPLCPRQSCPASPRVRRPPGTSRR